MAVKVLDDDFVISNKDAPNVQTGELIFLKDIHNV